MDDIPEDTFYYRLKYHVKRQGKRPAKKLITVCRLHICRPTLTHSPSQIAVHIELFLSGTIWARSSYHAIVYQMRTMVSQRLFEAQTPY
jgi:hypothetical protein